MATRALPVEEWKTNFYPGAHHYSRLSSIVVIVAAEKGHDGWKKMLVKLCESLIITRQTSHWGRTFSGAKCSLSPAFWNYTYNFEVVRSVRSSECSTCFNIEASEMNFFLCFISVREEKRRSKVGEGGRKPWERARRDDSKIINFQMCMYTF